MKKSNILTIVLALVAVAAIIFGVVTNGQKTGLQKEIEDLKANVQKLTSDLDAAKNAHMACALFDPDGFYQDYDTPWRFRTMDQLKQTLMEQD